MTAEYKKGLDNLTKIESVSLNRRIQDKIRNYIKANSLRPGDRLPTEAVLAERIGVSRTAIREALRGLEALGFIKVQKGRGRFLRTVEFSAIIDDLAYSLELSSADLTDLLEIRMVLEIAFIKKAVTLLTEEDFQDLEEILERMYSRAREGKSFAEEDKEFHQCLFRRSQNKLLTQLLETFWTLFLESLPESLKLAEHNDLVLQHHGDLLASIKENDYASTVRLLTTHFTDVYARLLGSAGQRSVEPVVLNGGDM